MIRVGIAGLGFMGWIHWLAYQKVPGIKVAAIHSRDKKKLRGDWRKIQGILVRPASKSICRKWRPTTNTKICSVVPRSI